MSVFLGVNNINHNIDKHKTLYYNDLNQVLQVNKSFLDNTATNSQHFDNNKGKIHNISNIEEPLNKNYEHELLNLIETSHHPNPIEKNGNFNIYNRCVFFINNNSNENKNTQLDNQIKNYLSLSESSKQNNGINFNVVLDNRRDKSHKEHKRKQTEIQLEKDSFSIKNNCFNTSNNKNTKSKLFYLHKNELRPVLSTNIKSGVYKRFCQDEKQSTKIFKNKIYNNVFVSSNEKNGKILPNSKFIEIYNKERNYITTESDALLLNKINNNFKITENLEENQAQSEIDECILHMEKIQPQEKFKEIIDKNSPRRRTIYKVINPSLFSLECPNDKIENYISSEKSSEQTKLLDKVNILTKNRKKNQNKKDIKTQSKKNDLINETPTIISTTRSGRICKTPQFIQKNFKLNKIDDIINSTTFERDNDEDYKFTKEIFPNCTEIPEINIKRDRTIPSNARCNYCQKIFLGNRMKRHLGVHSDFINSLNVKENDLVNNLSLYKFLVKKIKQTPEEHRAETFLKEISDLVHQLEIRGSSFIQNPSGVHHVNLQSSKILGIPEGHYNINVNDIDSIPQMDSIQNDSAMMFQSIQPKLDYNLSISLDDTISDSKLNLTDNIISSEESLLRTVNDLVEQGINNLTGNSEIKNNIQKIPVIHYDHASDNAVEATTIKIEQNPPILDLSLDLFQFKSN